MTLLTSRVRWLSLTAFVTCVVLFIVNPSLTIQSQSKPTPTPTMTLPPPPLAPTVPPPVPPPQCPVAPASVKAVSLTEKYIASLMNQDAKATSKPTPVSFQYPKGWIADGGGEKTLILASDKSAKDAVYYGKPLAGDQVYFQIVSFTLPPGANDAIDAFNNQPPSQDVAYSRPVRLTIGTKTVGCYRTAGLGVSPENELHYYTFSEGGNNIAVGVVTARDQYEKQRSTIEAIIGSLTIGSAQTPTAIRTQPPPNAP